jgi:hypothetical protein
VQTDELSPASLIALLLFSPLFHARSVRVKFFWRNNIDHGLVVAFGRKNQTVP